MARLQTGQVLAYLAWNSLLGMASSERREGPKVDGDYAVRPPEVPPDPAIYTYHARALSLDGWKEWGVSTKGRKPTPDELDWVNRVR